MLVRNRSELGELTEAGRLTSSRGSTVFSSVRVDGREIGIRWAGLRGAVTNSIAEVCVGAKTSGVTLTAAAQGRSKTKHSTDAVLLSRKCG
jgi:hypothetical protein